MSTAGRVQQLLVEVGRFGLVTMASVPVVHNVALFASVRCRVQMTKEEQSAVNSMQRNGPLWWDGMTPGNVVVCPCTHPLRLLQVHLHA